MVQLPDAQTIIPEYYLGTCTNTGRAPLSVQVSFWFGAFAIFLVTVTVATALYGTPALQRLKYRAQTARFTPISCVLQRLHRGRFVADAIRRT